MDFTGREVKVEVADGQLVTGYVRAIENGALRVGTANGIVTLKGSDIRDLDVLPPSNPPSKTTASSNHQHAKAQNKNGKKPKKQQQQPQRKNQKDQDWDGSTEEFDFDASNRRFDKQAEFARIASEGILPSIKKNYAPHEMVTQAPAQAQTPSQPNPVQQTPPIATPVNKQGFPRSSPQQKFATGTQLAEVEGYMLGKGWSTAALAESAGRGILDVILNILGYPVAYSTFVLAGNHRSGIRSLVAGRLLAAKGARVTAVVPYNLSPPLEGYVPAFEAAGGRIIKTKQDLDTETQNHPPTLIIDALQGFDNVHPTAEESAVASWLVGWANGFPSTFRLSVDSISPRLLVNSLVSCGLPLPAKIDSGKRFVVDVGIPAAVLKQLNLENLAVQFGPQSLVQI